ncbi:MAG TPA: hypothetical protein VGA77_10400 [Propylenella sp.]
MRTILQPAALMLATIALCLAGGDSASAAPIKSKVNITKAFDDLDGVVVRGNVTSAKPACLKNRRVRVYHDVDPPGPSLYDFFLGEAVTNAEGKWRLASMEHPDKVYAKVLKKKRPGRDCGGDRSPTEPVEVP